MAVPDGGTRWRYPMAVSERGIAPGLRQVWPVVSCRPLQRADKKGILGTAAAGALAFELAMRLVGIGLFQHGDLRFGRQDVILRRRGFERLEPVLHRNPVMALPDAAQPGRRDRPATLLQRLGRPTACEFRSGR